MADTVVTNDGGEGWDAQRDSRILARAREVTLAVNNSATVTSSTSALRYANFTARDEGRIITGTGIPAAPAVPATPTSATATTGGTLVAATYGYKVTYSGSIGETAASAEQTQVVPAGTSTNTVTLTIAAKPAWASVAKVYGRTSGGTWGLLGTTATTSFLDDGSATPGAAAPVAATAPVIVQSVTDAGTAVLSAATTGGSQTVAASLATETRSNKKAWIQSRGIRSHDYANDAAPAQGADLSTATGGVGAVPANAGI